MTLRVKRGGIKNRVSFEKILKVKVFFSKICQRKKFVNLITDQKSLNLKSHSLRPC